MASNNEWLHIYNNNLIGPSQQRQQPSVLRWSDDVVTQASTVTTTPTASSSVSNQLGRVTRPTNMRRRSRVSRKTPTTLLNTDTTNFRAMVQQFTGGGGAGVGGGSTAFFAAPATVAPRQTLSSCNNNSAGLDYYGTGSRISPIASGAYNAEFRQPQGQQYYTMVEDNGSGGSGGDHQHGFVQRVQEGGIFSGDNSNNGGKHTTNMF